MSRHPPEAGPAPAAGGPAARRPPRAPLRRHPFLCLAAVAALALLAAAAAWGWGAWAAARSLGAAQAALERRDFAAARAHLADCLRRRPDDPALHLLAARAARRAGLYAEAEAHLDRCQRLGGVTDDTRLEWDLLHVQQGELGAAERRLRETITPEHPQARLVLEALAQGYLKAERLADALEALALWLGRWPNDPQALAWRGWAAEHLGDARDAAGDYRRALESDPDHFEARLGLARVLLRGHEAREAAGHFERLLQARPDEPEVLLGLAGCKAELDDRAGAALLLDRLLAGHPHDARALAERGKLALAAGESERAERWLREAVARAPDDREALYRLVQCLRREGKAEVADRLDRELAGLTKDLRRLDEIIRAVFKKPQDAELRCEAGRIALRRGREAEGLRWLDGALRLDPRHRGAHEALAEYFEGKGQAEEAARHRRAAGQTGLVR
jgi:tetratricopeptide (TPR) repeat protein